MITSRPFHISLILLFLLSFITDQVSGQEKQPDNIETITGQHHIDQILKAPNQVVYFDRSSNLWVVWSWNHLSGDTLNIPGLFPHEGTPYLTGCCTETIGWYDTITGLNILVPDSLTANDTLKVSFAADRIELSSVPECYTGQEHIINSRRFSRTTELRLKGPRVYYSFGNKRSPGKWALYTYPLLINRSGVLWLSNKEQGKGPSQPVIINLIRIHDFEGIKSNPLPVSPQTTDQLFYLNDRDTTVAATDSNVWVTWHAGNIELLFNPGMGRRLLSLSVGFLYLPDTEYSLPKEVEVWGSSHNGQWECLTTKHIKRKTRHFCQRQVIPIPEPQREFRFYKIILKTKGSKLSIDEMGFNFSKEE